MVQMRESGDFLGVTLDSKLKFDLHIDNICKKVSRSIGVLFKLQNLLNTDILRQLYFALIFPYLNYCNLAWGATYQTHLERLFLLQKKAIRIINKKERLFHTNQLFITNRILKLPDIHLFNTGVYMCKSIRNDNSFPASTYSTRSHNNLIPQFQRLTASQRSLGFLGPKLWNQLPSELTLAPNLGIFKGRLRDHLLSKYRDQNS